MLPRTIRLQNVGEAEITTCTVFLQALHDKSVNFHCSVVCRNSWTAVSPPQVNQGQRTSKRCKWFPIFHFPHDLGCEFTHRTPGVFLEFCSTFKCPWGKCITWPWGAFCLPFHLDPFCQRLCFSRNPGSYDSPRVTPPLLPCPLRAVANS